MKAFHQAKVTLILTSEDLIFVYFDPHRERPKNHDQPDIKDQDSLFFFRRDVRFEKLCKKIDLEGIRDI